MSSEEATHSHESSSMNLYSTFWMKSNFALYLVGAVAGAFGATHHVIGAFVASIVATAMMMIFDDLRSK